MKRRKWFALWVIAVFVMTSVWNISVFSLDKSFEDYFNSSSVILASSDDESDDDSSDDSDDDSDDDSSDDSMDDSDDDSMDDSDEMELEIEIEDGSFEIEFESYNSMLNGEKNKFKIELEGLSNDEIEALLLQLKLEIQKIDADFANAINWDDLKKTKAEFEHESRDSKIQEIHKMLQAFILETYTDDELNHIREIEIELENDDVDRVLDVDSIVKVGSSFKFDVPPVIKNSRTLIPVRAISEGFGGNVVWLSEERKVKIYVDGKEIELELDNRTAWVNGTPILLDTEAEIIGNRTFVPLRFISEALGKHVEWYADTGVIEITD